MFAVTEEPHMRLRSIPLCLSMMSVLSAPAWSAVFSCDARVSDLKVDNNGWVWVSSAVAANTVLRICNVTSTAQYPQGSLPGNPYVTVTPDTCRAWVGLLQSAVSRSPQTSPLPAVRFDYDHPNLTS